MEIVKKLKKDKVGESANGLFKKRLTNLKKEIKLDWKTIKVQLSMDMLKFSRFLKRLLITDKTD